MKKYILLISLILTSALSYADLNDSVQSLIQTAKLAFEIPDEINKVSDAAVSLLPKLKCLSEDAGSDKCNEVKCTDLKACVGTSLATSVKLLDPIINTLLGDVVTEVRADGKKADVFYPALIGSVLNILPSLANSMPSKIKNSRAFTKIKSVTDKIPRWMAGLGKFTKVAQTSNAFLNGLSFVLAPEAAIDEAKKLPIPPVELEQDEDDDLDFDFGT